MNLRFVSKKAQWSVFTSRRLTHINDTLNKLKPRVRILDSSKVDLKPIEQELAKVEQDSKNIKRKVRNCQNDLFVLHIPNDFRRIIPWKTATL